MNRTAFHAWLDDTHRPPLVMGILNVTPDSFSDGGKYADHETACAHAREMVAQGADLIDIGGESTRPGALPVPADEQIRRVVPVIAALRREMDVLISIDTTRAAVAEAATDAGADILNDVTAARDDPEMLPLAARRGLPIILMHMQGEPGTMQQAPSYADVVAEVKQFLAQRLAAAVQAGLDRALVLLDPGIGFGKTVEHNLLLLRHMDILASLGPPLVIGTSRKRFIGAITGEDQPSGRLMGTAATVAWSVLKGAGIVRVHDVGPIVQVVRMIRAIQLDPEQ
jgi:dihydropteroate synthase